MTRFIIAACAALLASQSIAAPTPLSPTGKWIVDYAEQRCTASRAFGTADKPVVLVIKRAPVGDVFQLLLVRPARAEMGAIQQGAALQIGTGAKFKIRQLAYGAANNAVRLINLDKGQAALLSGADSLTWSTDGNDQLFELGPMSQLVRALESCRDDLRKYWNIVGNGEPLVKQPPSPDSGLVALFSTDDYPAQAVMNREGGTTAVILLVDEQGKLADCMVTETSGIATLDAMTCQVIRKRAKFRPATGLDDKPVKGAFFTRIRWEIPAS